MPLTDSHLVKEFLQGTAAATALARLTYLKLARRFPALVAYLSLLVLSHFVAGGLSRRSTPYFWFYIALIPIECTLGIFAVRELIALIFTNYPGIRTVGRWALYAGMAVSVAASALLTKLFSYTGPQPRLKLGLLYFEMAKR